MDNIFPTAGEQEAFMLGFERGSIQMRERAARFVKAHRIYPYSNTPVRKVKMKAARMTGKRTERAIYADCIMELPVREP